MPLTHRHILVPIDFSHHATLALDEAADLAQKYQAQLTVIYVIPQAIFHPDWAADVEDTLDLSDVTEEVHNTLSDMIAPYRQRGLTIAEQVLSGGPVIEIVRCASRVRADLIVMGAHGTAGGKTTLMGSVAEKVMREAPCSVLTVRETSSTAAQHP